jgi:type VI secretion system protein ImpK
MSEKDQFPEPDGRDERTIFRPLPPSRPPQRAQEAEGQPVDPPGMTRVQGLGDERTVFRPNPAGRRPQAEPDPARGPVAAAPRKAAVQGPLLAAPNANPVMRAASPLLVLLGRLRTALVRAPDSGMTSQIAAAIEKCDAEMMAAGVAPEDAGAAKLALCASADEVLANIPGDERAAGGQPGLMTRFFGEKNGDRRFFDEIDRVEKDPRRHFFLLELFHACLALAYQGAAAGSGAAAAMTDLRALLQKTGPAAPAALSPHWQGQPLASHAVRLRVPLWTVAGLVGLTLFSAFIGFRVSIGQRSEAAAKAIGALNPQTPVTIGRKVEVEPPRAPPPTPAQASQLDHIRNVLAPNISAGTLSVNATANQIVIRIVDRDLFQPGKSTILDDVKPLMMYVAMALDDEKGAVKVAGHSDNVPISNARFASNFELSLERANVVGALLKQALSHPERVETEGKGADAPIASNDSPEGRAKNRRVEIIVNRND